MNVETRLTELIGEPARRLHTARSRNDQVATDFRLWVRDQCDAAIEALTGAAARPARPGRGRAPTWVMPGFTHLQAAQPVTWGHHMMAYVEMLGRDRGRFARRPRADERMPARRRGAGRDLVPDRPPHDGRGAGLRPARWPTRSTRCRTATSRWSSWRPPRICAIHLSPPRRGAGDLVHRPVPLRAAVGPLLHRLLDHAAEAQPRRGRAGARQDRPDPRRAGGAADGDEGPAARLFQGHAGGQGAGLRRRRQPDAGARRDDRDDRAT